jgi:F-type H+-transporting ATPase subunit gamma
MPSIKHIKRRIASIKGTKQIMKAMNLVAASKLQKNKQQRDAIRPMFLDIQDVMRRISRSEDSSDNVFFSERQKRDGVKTRAYVVIAGDRGLCGGYNINLAKFAIKYMRRKSGKDADPEVIIASGVRGRDYLRRRGKKIDHSFHGPTEAGSFDVAKQLADLLTGMFLNGEIDEAYVIYTTFKTVLTHVPYAEKILPIPMKSEGDGEARESTVMLFDPDLRAFLEEAVPLYLNTVIYGALVEAGVCEEASRMTSMDAAANNATEIIDDLSIVYNRTRQGIITQEITEIVSGANALK